MKKTMAEKLLSHSSKTDAKSGDIVIARVDCAMMDDILGPRSMDKTIRRYNRKLKNPESCVVISDHYSPAATVKQADILMFTRKWVKEYGVKHYYEGIGPCHQILAEKGFALPGSLLVGTDSHTCMAGAFGCFGTGIGTTEMAGVLLTGEIWLRVPESIFISCKGTLTPGVMAKDLILSIIGRLGHDGATYMALEFGGNAIPNLPMDERLCLCNMAVEAGAKTGLIPADDITRDYLHNHGCSKEYSALYADADAVYADMLECDLNNLSPQIAAPHDVDNVHPVGKLEGQLLDAAYIGSCTGGRLHDLRKAAAVLKGRHISSDCRLLVSPASQLIWQQAAKEGILLDMANAGATILPPTCGACLGIHSGLLSAGESCISTTNRNFKGRMGSPDSFVYLASPVTVAASALTGRITDPRYIMR